MTAMTDELRNFANSLHSGYLKEWKANTIISVLKNDMPHVIQDRDRLLSYIRNCLLMEGFRDEHCVFITNWIQENLK